MKRRAVVISLGAAAAALSLPAAAKDAMPSVPAPKADAGSIDQYGIELAVILGAGIAAVIGSSG